MSECVFCKIINGEIPSSRVYEDESFIAFLDISPANKGHTLVVTKGHFESFNEIPKEILSKYLLVVQKVSKSLVKATMADGYNILMNNDKTAGQLVPHAHFHIIPRFGDDGLKMSLGHKKYDDGEMETFRDKISLC